MGYLGVDNQTAIRLCPPAIDNYIQNLTSSYTEKSNEASMVSASVIMFVLAGLFFNLNLFSGISDVSATLDPKVRLFLSSALSLLLPVMSYLFSEAKNAAAGSPGARAAAAGELSLGALTILAWMLLVELLRKKVDEIRMRGYSGSIQRAGRVALLGSFVFFNIKTAGRKAAFSILWIICATRVVQRIAFTEIGKCSYAHGKNARLINSYMAKILKQEQLQHHAAVHSAHDHVEHHDGHELLKSCRYIVMGEEKMVQEPTADGYKLDMTTLDADRGIVTVGKVWKLDENSSVLFTTPDQVQRLKRLCLSFALFKLLRRKFEHLPAVTDEEAQDCRDLILKGLLRGSNGAGSGIAGAAAEELFQVINDEVVFLSEYYHSVVPVVLASPFFLLVNYFLVLIVVAGLCIMAIILCGNGDAIYAFMSIGADNYTLHSGIGNVALCLIIKSRNSPEAFFSVVDISITILLFIIYFYEEIWEFFVFILSNWFMVSLVCSYMAKPQWRDSPSIRYAMHRIVWLRSKLNHGSLSFRQFSVLNIRWPLGLPFYSTLSLLLGKELVPNNLKQSIIQYLVDHHDHHRTGTAYSTPLTNGKSALQSNYLFDKLSWACQSDSVSEVFLTWHIATSILEVRCSNTQQEAAASRASAIRLSKYCAYLVVFHPELLPDNPEKAERVVDGMKAELSSIFWWWEYYLFSQHARVSKIMGAAAAAAADDEGQHRQMNGGVVRNGARLGGLLVEVAQNHGPEAVWKAVAEVWTELIVFVAPSGEEERVKGHGDVLVQGGEFITVLWALATHIGVSREANRSMRTLEDLMGDSMRAPPVDAVEITMM
ncbi:uncharacterized protein LOC120702425 [Panicum virgatum]|uniref:DUF4220 domain-containing protein n=1 Tax=Panicum virgatum TaxID=38727 RepID=A0A8T0THD9_PANVG|nr:uncharacterized protein LOC120702425 [Panicum virgatum]KAG2609028.1 hypothetical protein PVAP13_4KG166300 [Panicum virgatum]